VNTASSHAANTGRSGGISGLIALLAGAHFSHHVLTAMLIPLLPFIRNEFGLSYAQSGIVTSAFTVAYGIAQLPAGWLSDRLGPRYLLLVGISGVAAAGVLVGLSPVFPLLLAALLVMGVAGGGYHPAASAVIAKVVRPKRRGRAMGVHIVGGSSSHFLAPLIAAGLVALIGWRGSFLALSVPVAALGLVLFGMIHRRIERGEPARRESAADGTERTRAGTQLSTAGSGPAAVAATTAPAGSDARAVTTSPAGATAAPPSDTGDDAADEAGAQTPGDAGRGSSHRHGRVTSMVFFLILTGLIGATTATLIPFIPLYLVDARGVDERLAAGFISIIYGAGFFAAPLGGWLSDVFGRVRVMIVIGVIAAPVIALVTITPFPLALGALLLFMGVLMFTKMPTAEAHIASEVSERFRTTVLGIYFFSGMEGSAILTPLLGATIDRWGFRVGILGLAGLAAAVAIVCGTTLVALRAVRPATGAAA
jgi:MFS family permease